MRRRRQVESIRRTVLVLLLAAGPAAVLPSVAAAELSGTPVVLAGDLIELRSTIAHSFAAGYDLSEGMVYTGWALATPAAGDRYGAVQEQAKRSKHGLWQGRFVAPWAWSAGKRLPEENGN